MFGVVACWPVDVLALPKPRLSCAAALLFGHALGILLSALRWCLSRGVAYALHGATFAP